MSKQLINTGTAANDGTGDTLRAASLKINSNFNEVYSATDASFGKANSAHDLASAAFSHANSISFSANSLVNGANTLTLNDDGSLTVPGVITGTENAPSWSDSITNISLGVETIITTSNTHFGGPITGQIEISGVNGTTQVNGTWYYQAWNYNQLRLYNDVAVSNPVDSTSWTTYVDGGTALNLTGGGLSLQANYNRWDFNADGNLYVPGNVVVGGGSNSNGTEQHFIIDSTNYWTSIQWKNFNSPQDPNDTPFECQAQLLRVFANENTVTAWCNVQNPREELVALTAVKPNGTSFNGMMFSTSDTKIPDSPYNDGTGTRHDWILHGDGTTQFPNMPTNARTGNADALVFSRNANARWGQKSISTQGGTVDNPTVERLVIAGGDGYRDPDTNVYTPYSEGGDIYLWAGRGADGGDIKVDAGNSYGTNGELGGDIKIRGGSSTSGQGGFVHIESGSGATSGEIHITTPGHTWNFAGDGKLYFPNNANTDGADFFAQSGNYIEFGSSDQNNYVGVDDTGAFIQTNWNVASKQWTFDKEGNLILPNDNHITTPQTLVSAQTGTEYTGLTYTSVGNGTPYQYVIIGTNQAFNDWFALGSGIVGYKVFTTGNPSSVVNVIGFLGQTLGGPSIEFDGPVPASPWTVQSSDYVAPVYSYQPVNVKVAANTWSFNTDGTTTLPGPIVNPKNITINATGSGDPAYPTALDLAASINKLTNNTGSNYTLADGYEGQIMHLVPKNGATTGGICVVITNARILRNADRSTSAEIIANAAYYPFANSTDNPVQNIATLIFTDGAWNASTGSFDY
jgi:hypothetical protein